MTARELLATDEGFRSLIALWVTERRCPLVMADYLREKSLPLQAEAAEWCSWYRDRTTYGYLYGDVPPNDDPPQSGIYPNRNVRGEPFTTVYAFVDEWYWYGDKDLRLAHHLPPELGCWVNYERWLFTSPDDALVAILDGWADAAVAGVTLPKATVGLVEGMQ